EEHRPGCVRHRAEMMQARGHHHGGKQGEDRGAAGGGAHDGSDSGRTAGKVPFYRTLPGGARRYHGAMDGTHQVLIVGGGLVGASLALALDRAGVPATLVKAAPSPLPEVFDQRNLSLAETTVNALTRLGVVARLRAPAGEIGRIHASRRGAFGGVLLDARDYGRDRFGLVVVARDLGHALEDALAATSHLRRLRARVTGVGQVAGGVR